MIKLLNWLFGKRKDGKCRWWNHEYVRKEEEGFFDTGVFLDGKPLQKRMGWGKYTCKKCGHQWKSDNYRIW